MHGEAFKYYEGGGVKEKMNFIDGKIHGKAFGFREDGALAVINYFEEGRLLKFESYFPSGILESELIYDRENIVISRKEFYETGVLKPLELSLFSKVIENELNDSLSFICRIDNLKKEYYGRGLLVLTEKKEKNERDTLAILGGYSNVFLFSVAETSIKSDTLFFDLMVDYLGDSSDYFSTSFGVRDLLPIEKNDSINK